MVSIRTPAPADTIVSGAIESQAQEAAGTFSRESRAIQPRLGETLWADGEEPHTPDLLATIPERYGHLMGSTAATAQRLEKRPGRDGKRVTARAGSSHHCGPVVGVGRIRDRLAERFREPGDPTHRVFALLASELALPRKIDDSTRSASSHVGVLLVHFRRN
jgi:hypothetical protein